MLILELIVILITPPCFLRITFRGRIKLLKPWKDQLPEEIFTSTYKPPISDGSGMPRKNLRIAKKI